MPISDGYLIPYSLNSMAHFNIRPNKFSLCNMLMSGWFVSMITWWTRKYGRSFWATFLRAKAIYFIMEYRVSAIKRPSVTRRPVKCCNSFFLLGVGVLRTTFVWGGLTSIPLWVTINPRNLPALTPKTLLVRLSFMLYVRISRNIFFRSWACSLQVLLFTTMLSM